MVWIKFLVCAAIILLAGRNVAKYGDIIAEKTGLGGAFIGTILIAITTSLPELFTGISAVALADVPDITVGNLFGANAFNLLNLALLDIASRRHPLLAEASLSHGLVGGLSLIILAFAAGSLLLAPMASSLAIGWVGVYTPVLFFLYLAVARMIYSSQTALSQDPLAVAKYRDASLTRAYLYYAVAAAFIIGAGIWLAFIGEEIASTTGLGQNFVGSLFIAFSTTLPEITVSFSALRLGAYDMCVGNMLGSNLFNMTIIGIDDIFYRQGPILGAVSQGHVFTALVVTMMTGVFLAGLFSRPQPKALLGIRWYSLALILIFILGALGNYHLGRSL